VLSLYTRHYPPCAQTDPYYRRCHCPKWIMGTVETTGAFVGVSARTRAWERAEKKARLMDANPADPSPARVTVEAALDAFIARKRGQRLSHRASAKNSEISREWRSTSKSTICQALCRRIFLFASSEFCKKRFTIQPNTAGCGTSNCDCGECRVRFI
jgi:hypothetical protein